MADRPLMKCAVRADRGLQEAEMGGDTIVNSQTDSSMRPTAQSNAGRIQYLDGWRAIAVGLVVLAHTLSVYGIKILQVGTLGVYLFFGISGYIITRLLLRERRTTGAIDIQAFYVRRVARIFPPLLIYVFAVLLVWPDNSVVVDAMRSLTLSCNIGINGGCARIFEHIWSLSFEEQFYLIYPLLLAGLWRWWLTPLLAIWILPFLIPVPFIGHGGFARIMLIMGMAALFAAFEAKAVSQFARIPRALLLAMPPLLVAWASTEGTMTHKLLGAILPFAIILTLFALPERFPSVGKALTFGLLGRVGLYSYTFYLWQQFFSYPWEWNTGAMPALGVVAALAIAAVSYHTIETACRNWARQFLARRKSRASAGEPLRAPAA